MDTKTYIIFRQHWWCTRCSIAYIDTTDYKADDIFIKHSIKVKFTEEYMHPNDSTTFHVIFCSIKKKDLSKFDLCMQELSKKMLLCGYTNYIEYSSQFMDCILNSDYDTWIATWMTE